MLRHKRFTAEGSTLTYGAVLTHNVGIFNVIFNYVVNGLEHKAQRQHMGLALTHNVDIFNVIFIPLYLCAFIP